MNCQNHPDIPATAYCRTCGKAVCDECRRDASGTVFCGEHGPVKTEAAPPPPPPPPRSHYSPRGTYSSGISNFAETYAATASAPRTHESASPGLALGLGFIPGVGAIYNGQYAKGLVHAVIFGIIISILNSTDRAEGIQIIFSFILTAWIFYMAFEAYHTARKRRHGEPVDEYSGLFSFRASSSAAPVAGAILVLLGIVLLLQTLHLFDFAYLARYWPVLLIAAGLYLLYSRYSGGGESKGL